LRVVGGSARGKRLILVPGQGTRPILDRVKTALFDILRPRIAGSHFLDLFAGSGSVGIEALSQGAAWCTFIDRAPRAVATIKTNLQATGLAHQAEVLRGDGRDYLRDTKRSFDVIYIAPPQYKKIWIDALGRLAERPELVERPVAIPETEHPSGIAIAQIDPREYEVLDLGVIEETRQKRYGNTLLVFYERGSTALSRETTHTIEGNLIS
jgi:16S rRNA (guanine966-N2)-methyltransferase